MCLFTEFTYSWRNTHQERGITGNSSSNAVLVQVSSTRAWNNPLAVHRHHRAGERFIHARVEQPFFSEEKHSFSCDSGTKHRATDRDPLLHCVRIAQFIVNDSLLIVNVKPLDDVTRFDQEKLPNSKSLSPTEA